MSKASRISGNTLKIKYPTFAGKWGATIPYRSTPLFSIREKETRFDVEFYIGWSNAIQSDTNLNSKHIENHTPDVDVLAVHLFELQVGLATVINVIKRRYGNQYQ